MAPEVLDCRPYNTSVDVYSAGVILLELLEPGSEKPFSELTLDNFHRQVVGAGYRPGRAGGRSGAKAVWCVRVHCCG